MLECVICVADLQTVGEFHLVCWWLRSVLLGVTQHGEIVFV
jgi:hypothetical protein